MNALREAKAWLAGMRETPLTTSGKLLAALVDEIEAAPVVTVSVRGTTFGHGDHGEVWVIGDSYSPPPASLTNGQRVRVLAVGEEG